MAQGIRIEKERIKAIKDWPELQSVRDILIFLSFANFYRKFIQSFSKIAAPHTLILQTTDDEALSTQATGNKKNQEISSGIARAGFGEIDVSFENLSTAAKLAKSKKPLVKANSSKTDFLTSEAKSVFIHL